MRIRTIKPEYWSHPILTRLSYGARLLGVALLNYADDAGYFYADPDMVRGAIMFREDSANVRRWLDELSATGYIETQEHPTHGTIGRVQYFSKHQRVDRPRPSTIAGLWDSSKARRGFADDSTEEGNGMEGNGKGKETRDAEIKPMPPAIRPILANMVADLVAANQKKSRTYRATTGMLLVWPVELWDLMNARSLDMAELGRVLNWTQAHDFWAATIQSPTDLAKHWDKIVAQMNRKPAGIISATQSATPHGIDMGEGMILTEAEHA